MSALPNKRDFSLAVADLESSALYMAPTGRLCRMVALDGRGGDDPIARLQYVVHTDQRQASEWENGFNLRRENWRILLKVG